MAETRDDNREVVQARLTSFLVAMLPADAAPRVHRLSRSDTGTSRENWSFTADWFCEGRRATSDLILRRDPEVGVVETGRLAEFRLLEYVSSTDIPAPEVLWLDESGARLQRPSVIMRRYPGRAHRSVLRPADPLGMGVDQQVQLAQSMCDVLADLHQLSPAHKGVISALGDPPFDPAASELQRWTARLDAVELEPQPALRIALDWMLENVPARPQRQTIVHGDFRPGNVLVDQGRISSVLDWELAHLGDPVDDLGWYTCRVYTDEHFIADRWSQSDLLRRYQARTGHEVETDRLRFWQVMSAFRLTVMALAGVQAFCSGATDRPARGADWLARIALQSIVAVEGA